MTQKNNISIVTALEAVSSNILGLLYNCFGLAPESKVSVSEISAKESIFLKMIYASVNSKRFIRSNIIQFLPRREKGEGFHHLLVI